MKRLTYLFIVLSIFVSCGNAQTKSQISTAKKGVVEVIYFHGKQRCPSCMAIESLTKEVVATDFKKEIESGKMVFKIVDITENEALADKYEVAYSSLILDKNGKTVNLTEMGFSYAKGQPEVFKAKLKTELMRILK